MDRFGTGPNRNRAGPGQTGPVPTDLVNAGSTTGRGSLPDHRLSRAFHAATSPPPALLLPLHLQPRVFARLFDASSRSHGSARCGNRRGNSRTRPVSELMMLGPGWCVFGRVWRGSGSGSARLGRTAKAGAAPNAHSGGAAPDQLQEELEPFLY